ncbi:MAG: hypothetical protein ACM3UO_00150 [Bacillota bacterium]
MSNINWTSVYQHLVLGLISALGVFASLAADAHVTWHTWVAAASAFLIASGGSALTPRGVGNPPIPQIDLGSDPSGTATMLDQSATLTAQGPVVTPAASTDLSGTVGSGGGGGGTATPLPPA